MGRRRHNRGAGGGSGGAGINVAALRQQLRGEIVAELSRALIASPTSAPAATAIGGAPYGAYAFDRPFTFLTPQAPTRKPSNLGLPAVTTRTLRTLADTYDILRACINHLKRELAAVPLEIAPRDAKDDSPATMKRLAEAKALFDERGPIGGVGWPRRHFENQLIEDVCVVGAGAIYHQRNRSGGAFQGGVYESVALDAATIRPVTDQFGWPPTDDGEGAGRVYEQWVEGILVAQFGRADLSYDGIHSVSYSPYFKSPVEYLIFAVNAALRTDAWNLGWLTDGNTPSDLLALPAEWNPQQVIAFQAHWDAMLSGNSAKRQGSKFVPGGTSRVGNPTRKEQDFAGWELWLARRCGAIMGVALASIGFAGEQYKTSQENSQESTSQFGAGALLDFRKATYDDLLVRYGYPEFEAVNVVKREEKAKDRAETNAVLIKTGQRTINECRRADGEEPIEGGDVLLIEAGLQPLVPADGDEGENPQGMTTGDAQELSLRTNAAGQLVRAGFKPGASLAAVGLPDIEHVGLLPVTLKDTPAGNDPAPAPSPAPDPPPDPVRLARAAAGWGALADAVAAHRDALRDLEEGAVADMRAAYDVAEAAIRERLEAVTDRIAAAQEAGEPVSESWLYQQERYRSLMDQVQSEAAALAPGAADQLAGAQRAAAEQGAAGAEAMARAVVGAEAGVDLAWNALPADAIEALTGAMRDGTPLRAHLLAAFGDELAAELRDALVAAVTLGENPDRVGARLSGVLGTSRARAATIARTEVLRASRESARRAYAANPEVCTGYVRVCAGDGRCCPACFGLHGTRYETSEVMPTHPGCRCAMVPVTRSWAEITGDDSLPADTPALAALPGADELFGGLAEDAQRAVLGPGGFDAWKAGAPLAAFARVSEDERWGPTVAVATLDEVLAAVRVARQADLAKWERKAVSRLRAGKRSPECAFSSPWLPADITRRVGDGLAASQTVDDVKALFRALYWESVEETKA